MISIIEAFASMTLYLVGFAIFKLAAERMEPLHGRRPLHLIGQWLKSPLWFLGLVIFLLGLVPEVVALRELQLSRAMPIFVTGLVPILVIATTLFQERLRAREWLSIGLIAIAAILVSLSVHTSTPQSTEPAPLGKLMIVAIPSLLGGILLFYFGDRHSTGRHARPIAGIAYSVAGGVVFGTSEIAVKGVAATDDVTALVGTPNPYLIAVAGTIGYAMLLIALQRCRLAIIVSVGMITSKVHLMLAGGLLYGEAWPYDATHLSLRAAAFLAALLAVLMFPRHDPTEPALEDPAPVVLSSADLDTVVPQDTKNTANTANTANAVNVKNMKNAKNTANTEDTAIAPALPVPAVPAGPTTSGSMGLPSGPEPVVDPGLKGRLELEPRSAREPAAEPDPAEGTGFVPPRTDSGRWVLGGDEG